MNVTYQLFPKLLFGIKNPKNNLVNGHKLATAAKSEAELGGRLFGELLPGQKREFYKLSDQTWIWHEEWQDLRGKGRRRTTFYEIKKDGIYKSQEGLGTGKISGREAANLTKAIELYKSKVATQNFWTNKEC